jgi:hypothetical protein
MGLASTIGLLLRITGFYSKLSQFGASVSAPADKIFVFLDMREDKVNWATS